MVINNNNLLYIDAASLYSGIMTLPMPYKNFKWLDLGSAGQSPSIESTDDLLEKNLRNKI